MRTNRLPSSLAVFALAAMFIGVSSVRAADEAKSDAPKADAAASVKSSQPYWPEFHGPGRTNIAPGEGLLRKWPEAGPKLAWRFDNCGEGYPGVSIAEGRIFTSGDIDDVEYVIALDMDGKPLWKSPNGKAWRGASPGSRTTPTFHEGLVYQMNVHGRLAALEAASGRERWAVDLKERFDAEYGVWGLAENVVIEGGNVLCMPGGAKGRVVALDKRTGKTVWANTDIEHFAAYCSPVVVNHGGIRQLITMTQKSVVGIDVSNGKLLWTFPFVPASPQNALTPVYHDGLVFVACGHSSGGVVFRVGPDSRSAQQVWYRRDLDNCHGGAVLIGNHLFGCGCRQGGKSFYCVDFRTGATVKLDKSLGKVGISAAGDMLYCINHRGIMYLLAATPDGFDVASQFNVGKKPDNTYLAHPVIVGGRLYVRCEQSLMVYDVSAAK